MTKKTLLQTYHQQTANCYRRETSTRQQRFCIGQGRWRALRRANMSEGSKERSPQQLAKSRRDYVAQVKMLTVDERTREAAKINKALGIKAPKGTAAAATLDAARVAYIRLLGSLGSNAEVKAEVTCFCEQLDQMQLRMLDPKPRKRPTTSSPSTYGR
jgi:hypothetical protein